PGAAPQTRMVSVARIRLGSWESARAFKGIICDDVSEFESYMPSQAVRSLGAMSRPREFARHSRGLRRRWRVSVAGFFCFHVADFSCFKGAFVEISVGWRRSLRAEWE